VMNRVDEIASAASILMGQTAAARPVIIARGVPYTRDDHASLARLLIGPPLPGSVAANDQASGGPSGH